MSAPARWSSSSSSRAATSIPSHEVLLHGDEHPAAGGAPGDRGHHRPRPGRVAAARGRRRAAAAARRSSCSINGHAIEARICAENPDNGLPARHRPPRPLTASPRTSSFRSRRVRFDDGVREGDAISPFYDSMIAKLIVQGDTRAQALARLDAALAQTAYRRPGHQRRSSCARWCAAQSFAGARAGHRADRARAGRAVRPGPGRACRWRSPPPCAQTLLAERGAGKAPTRFSTTRRLAHHAHRAPLR